jgi:hypothetical protein
MAGNSIIQATFAYEAEVMIQRHRKSEPAVFVGRVPVTIRHVDMSAMTDAIRLHDCAVQGRTIRDLTLRSYDDVLYAPFLHRKTGQALAPEDFTKELCGLSTGKDCVFGNPFLFRDKLIATETEIAELVYGKHPDGEGKNHRIIGRSPEEMTAIDNPAVEVKTVLNSEFQHRAADAQRLATSFLIVDDEVWFRCHEPYWAASIQPCAVNLIFGPEPVSTKVRFASTG